MKKWGFITQYSTWRRNQGGHLLLFLCLLLFCCIGTRHVTATPVSIESPIGFFTNVANRLLKTQTTLDLNRIQVYPTNQYTPSIHRLLQVTANVYDCMTNRTLTAYPYVPSVFRPLFTNDNGVIYICGYAEETGTNLLNAPMRDLSDPADRAALQTSDMVWGVPAIVGVKKGFPGFNKFVQQIAVQATRRMQFRRPVGVDTPVWETNLMYMLSISNTFGLDAWNPYSTAFPRELRVVSRPQIRISVTDQAGTVLADSQQPVGATVLIRSSNSWAGYSVGSPSSSFLIPTLVTVPFLPASTYSHAANCFVPFTNVFETLTPSFYVPRWFLKVQTRVCFGIVDTTANRVVDYVNLASDKTETIFDVLTEGARCGNSYTPSGSPGSMWCTNSVSQYVPSAGMLNQIGVSLGQQPYTDQADWNSSLNEYPAGMDKTAAIDSFRNQFNLSPIYSHPAGTVFNKSNTFVAPYQPTRTVFFLTSWLANDPLVHHLVTDLSSVVATNILLDHIWYDPAAQLGNLGPRYQPWGRISFSPYWNYGPYDTTLKDPLVTDADSWDFPANLQTNLAGLGSVHRGTPWQTLYLKSASPSFKNWMAWTGDNLLVTNSGQFPTSMLPLGGFGWDAYFSMPTNDWRLCSLLISMLGRSPVRDLSSPNQGGAFWDSLLDGITVLTNTVPDDLVWPDNTAFAIETMTSNSPQAAVIAAGIEALRAVQPGQRFVSPGDILAAPQLSLASPWLNTSVVQTQAGVSDEAYEAVPSQLLLKLRPDSIASVSSAGTPLRFRFTAAENGTYGVQLSTNLLDWTLVSTNIPNNGVFEFEDPGNSNSSRRFYRSVLLP